jgi:trigger factor
LRDEAASNLLKRAIGQAIKDIKAISSPELEEMRFGDDESINATFSVEVEPEFELSNYKGLPLTRRIYRVSDLAVERAIQRLLSQHAELVPVEGRGAQMGDVVTAKVTIGFEDSDSEESQELDIELGEGTLKEFIEALSGTRPGDVRAFTVEYGPDYPNQRYAGRRASYRVEVIAVRAKELPQLDDEFARSISDEYKTLAELRAGVRSELERAAEHRSQQELRAAAFEALADRNRFPVPERLVEEQVESSINSLRRRLLHGGADPEQLRLRVDWEALRKQYREQAERQVRGHFILDRIAELEKIEVADQELDSELEELAASSQQSASALKARLTKEGSLDTIRNRIKHRKALDLIIASADLREEEVEWADEAA